MYPPAQHGVLHGLQCPVCSATASPLAAGAKPALPWLSPQAMGKLCSDAWSTSWSLHFLLTWVYGVVSHSSLCPQLLLVFDLLSKRFSQTHHQWHCGFGFGQQWVCWSWLCPAQGSPWSLLRGQSYSHLLPRPCHINTIQK